MDMRAPPSIIYVGVEELMVEVVMVEGHKFFHFSTQHTKHDDMRWKAVWRWFFYPARFFELATLAFNQAFLIISALIRG